MDKGIWIYFAFVSIVASVFTLIDKVAAITKKPRVSEAGLFAVALVGGAAAEYITMLLIRHKTRHKRFMFGLPIIIFVHAVLLFLYFNKWEVTL